MILTKTKLQKIIYEELEYAILERNVIKEELRHVLTEKKAKSPESKWKTVLKSSKNKPVLVIFGPVGCAPCASMQIYLDELNKKDKKFEVVKFNITEESEFAKEIFEQYKQQFNITGEDSYPLLVVFKNGAATGAYDPGAEASRYNTENKPGLNGRRAATKTFIESTNGLGDKEPPPEGKAEGEEKVEGEGKAEGDKAPEEAVKAAKASALQSAGAGLGAADGGAMKDAIMASKNGDKLKLNFQKDVDHMGVTVFKEGTEYEGIVQGQKGNNVSVDHENIIFVGSNTTMTKAEFIKKLASQDGEPCEILNCDSSTITRGNKSKSFVDYLADPTFGEKPAAKAEAPAKAEAEPAKAGEEPAKAEPAKAEPAKAQGTHEVFDTYKDPKGETYLALRTLPNPKNGRTIAKLPDGTSLVIEKTGLGNGKWAKIKVIGGQFANRTGFAHSGWIREKAAVAKTADGGGAGKAGVPESTPEALMTFMSQDGTKPLGVKEVYSKLSQLGVPSLKGRWHLQPLAATKQTKN
jgi:thiol-disulfide isomerase/thioredoxin